MVIKRQQAFEPVTMGHIRSPSPRPACLTPLRMIPYGVTYREGWRRPLHAIGLNWIRLFAAWIPSRRPIADYELSFVQIQMRREAFPADASVRQSTAHRQFDQALRSKSPLFPMYASMWVEYSVPALQFAALLLDYRRSTVRARDSLTR
jgi:hypothetical protein